MSCNLKLSVRRALLRDTQLALAIIVTDKLIHYNLLKIQLLIL